jgi:hypothetical protein
VTATLTVNDTRPDAVLSCSSDGVASNLIAATAVLHITRPDGTKITRTAPAGGFTITTAATGVCTYRWQAGDLTVAGVYLLEVQVTYSDAGIQTFGPQNVYVKDELA